MKKQIIAICATLALGAISYKKEGATPPPYNSKG